MADKKPAKGAAKAEYGGKKSLYVVQGAKLTRNRKACPKCGAGVYMAVHKERAHCGKCGFTEFNKKA